MYRISERHCIPLLLAFLLSASPGVAQEVSSSAGQRLSELRDNARVYENRQVQVVGIVDKYVTESGAEASHAGFYYLKDAFGDALLIRTTSTMPEPQVRYQITGTLSLTSSGQPYVAEESRKVIQLEGVAEVQTVEGAQTPTIGRTAVEETAGDAAVGAESYVPPATARDASAAARQWAWYLAALAGLLLVGIAVVAYRRGTNPLSRRGRPLRSGTPTPAARAAAPSPGPSGAAAEFTGPEPLEITEDRTIKFYSPPPGTIKVLRGRLDVERPERNTIRFFAAPTQDGETEVSFGREGGPPYRHVQLKLPSVSSKHAVLRVKNGKYLIRNMSATNPTRVNGRELAAEEWTELAEGDRVEMGEVFCVFRDS